MFKALPKQLRALPEGLEARAQVEQDGVVPVPGVQQSLKQAVVSCARHVHTPFVDEKIVTNFLVLKPY